MDQKIESLREVPRTPECCGKPMGRLNGISAATGNVVKKFHCERCGKQQEAV